MRGNMYPLDAGDDMPTIWPMGWPMPLTGKYEPWDTMDTNRQENLKNLSGTHQLPLLLWEWSRIRVVYVARDSFFALCFLCDQNKICWDHIQFSRNHETKAIQSNRSDSQFPLCVFSVYESQIQKTGLGFYFSILFSLFYSGMHFDLWRIVNLDISCFPSCLCLGSL